MLSRRRNGIVFWGLFLPLALALLTHCGQSTSPSKTLTGGLPPTSGCSLTGSFSGGSGTIADPFLISTFCDLQKMFGASSNWNKSFKLMVDFDLLNQDVGYVIDLYSGVFDGNSHTIFNYQSSHPLFIAISGTVKNFTLSNAQVSSSQISRSGLLSETVYLGATLSNVTVSGALSSALSSSFIGGLAAINNGTIQNSRSNVVIVGGAAVGGLVGHNNGTISKSWSSGSITGGNFYPDTHGAGGFAGSNNGTILDSFSTASVLGTSFVGGFVGSNWVLINRCYSIGNVVATGTSVGGFIGENISPISFQLTGTVSNSYWDTQTSGQPTSTGGTGKTTAQMQTQSTFTGWDFSNIWLSPTAGIYPTLR